MSENFMTSFEAYQDIYIAYQSLQDLEPNKAIGYLYRAMCGTIATGDARLVKHAHDAVVAGHEAYAKRVLQPLILDLGRDLLECESPPRFTMKRETRRDDPGPIDGSALGAPPPNRPRAR